MRFLFVCHFVGEQLAQQRGPWVKQPLDAIDASRIEPLSTHFFDGRPPLHPLGIPVGLQRKEEW